MTFVTNGVVNCNRCNESREGGKCKCRCEFGSTIEKDVFRYI